MELSHPSPHRKIGRSPVEQSQLSGRKIAVQQLGHPTPRLARPGNITKLLVTHYDIPFFELGSALFVFQAIDALLGLVTDEFP
jgi:hypothetical protein